MSNTSFILVFIALIIYCVVSVSWHILAFESSYGIPPIWYRMLDGIIKALLILGPAFIVAFLSKKSGLKLGVLIGVLCYIAGIFILKLPSFELLFNLEGLAFTFFGLMSAVIYSAISGLAGEYASQVYFNKQSQQDK